MKTLDLWIYSNLKTVIAQKSHAVPLFYQRLASQTTKGDFVTLQTFWFEHRTERSNWQVQPHL